MDLMIAMPLWQLAAGGMGLAIVGAFLLAIFVSGDDPAEDYELLLLQLRQEAYVEGALDEHNAELEELRHWRQTAQRNARLEQEKAEMVRRNTNLQIEVNELQAKLALHRSEGGRHDPAA